MVLPAKNKVAHGGKLCQHLPKMFNAGNSRGKGSPKIVIISLRDPSISLRTPFREKPKGQKAGGVKLAARLHPQVEGRFHAPSWPVKCNNRRPQSFRSLTDLSGKTHSHSSQPAAASRSVSCPTARQRVPLQPARVPVTADRQDPVDQTGRRLRGSLHAWNRSLAIL